MPKRITEKEAQFVAHYMADPDRNATQALIKAGYSPRSAPSAASQMLRKPKIIAKIEAIKALNKEKLPKETFIDYAISDYKQLDVESPNKPRFLDIAGRALGYLGPQEGQNQKNQQINLTQINISGQENQNELWELTRKLLGNG